MRFLPKFAAACTMFAALTAIPAHALPGEAAAVIRHCGEPHAENFSTSQVTGRPQRDLIYNAVILHFEPEEGGWSFTTAWKGHFPMTRNELENRLPCFKAAINEVAQAPTPAIDPTVARQSVVASPQQAGGFGIPYFWLIAALVVVTIIVFFLPRRREVAASRVPQVRPYRRPTLRTRIFRRKPTLPPVD